MPAFFISMNRSGSEAIIATITSLVEPVLADLGLELVEVQFRREKVGWVLRLLIFRDTGVTVDDCVLVSREVGNLLDVEDPIDQPYHLEVSSPGLDRPLKTAKDFLRHRGEKVMVTTTRPLDSRSEITGIIGRVMDNEVEVLAMPGQQPLLIPYAHIAKARLVIEF